MTAQDPAVVMWSASGYAIIEKKMSWTLLSCQHKTCELNIYLMFSVIFVLDWCTNYDKKVINCQSHHIELSLHLNVFFFSKQSHSFFFKSFIAEWILTIFFQMRIYYITLNVKVLLYSKFYKLSALHEGIFVRVWDCESFTWTFFFFF